LKKKKIAFSQEVKKGTNVCDYMGLHSKEGFEKGISVNTGSLGKE